MGRHTFLSEHLCRYFTEAGAECEPAVGIPEALRRAAAFEPHVVVCDGDLITPALFDSWATQPGLADVPVLAVSLTRRPADSAPVELSDLAAEIYLPGLETEQVTALLSRLYQPRGIPVPHSWRADSPASSVHSS